MSITNKTKDMIAALYVWANLNLAQFLELTGYDDGQLRATINAQHAGYQRGQTNLSGLILGITVASIIGIAVAVPVMQDVIADANLTGTDATIANLLPLFILLLILVAIASPLMNRM